MQRLILPTLAFLLLPLAASAQHIARLEVHPAERVLHAPGHTQQLSVIAHFPNGDQRDVTRLTTFISSDTDVAHVTRTGQVRFHQPGDVVIWCRFGKVTPIRLSHVAPKPDYKWVDPPVNNDIDRHVFAKLKEMRILPSDLADDLMFLRRAYIDACGILPSPPDLQRFMTDKRPNKRAHLIDELIARPEFADRWAHRFIDSLDIVYGRIEPKSGAALLHWMRGQINANIPLNQSIRTLLLGTTVVTEHGPIGYYSGATTPEEWAVRTAHNFLGVRLDCASCHLHLRGRWTADDYHGFVAFFSQLSVRTINVGRPPIEMVVFDKTKEWLHPQTKQPVQPRFLDGTHPMLAPGDDRRPVLAGWLTAPTNPFVPRMLANRIWAGIFNRGLCDAAEELHELPFTYNDALLEHLTAELVKSKFDMKHLVRHIMNSRTYQLSSAPNEHNKHDERYFARTYVRHVGVEVMIDMISQFIEAPMPIDRMPLGTKSIHVLDPSNAAYLPRNRPRLSECEMTREPNLASALHLLNSQVIQELLARPGNRAGRVLRARMTDDERLEEIFMAAFSRPPSVKERGQAREHIARLKKEPRQAWEDLLWAIINTKEFACRR